MNNECVEQLFSLIPKHQEGLVNHFFSNLGIAQVKSRVRYCMTNEDPTSILENCMEEIDQIGVIDFLSKPDLMFRLPSTIRGRIDQFQNAVGQVLTEHALIYLEKIPHPGMLVTNEQFIRTAHQIDPNYAGVHLGLSLKPGKDLLACPSGFGFQISREEIILREIYKYTSVIDSKIRAQVRGVRTIYEDYNFRNILQNTVQAVMDVDSRLVILPSLDEIKIIVVALQRSKDNMLISLPNNTGKISLNIANIRNLSTLVLAGLTNPAVDICSHYE